MIPHGFGASAEAFTETSPKLILACHLIRLTNTETNSEKFGAIIKKRLG